MSLASDSLRKPELTINDLDIPIKIMWTDLTGKKITSETTPRQVLQKLYGERRLEEFQPRSLLDFEQGKLPALEIFEPREIMHRDRY